MCKVSVIIPVYNRVNELMIPVNSIINQSFEDWELILVDDGSKDGSSELCDQLAKQDERIFAVHQTNSGVSVARNYGISLAKGEYILFIDSDDWIEKETIEKLVSRIELDQSDVVLFAMCIDRFLGELVNTSVQIYGKNTVVTQYELINQFVDFFQKDYLSSACTKLFKKDIILENKILFHKDLVMYEDLHFVLDYLSKVNRISISNSAFYHYRMDETVLLIEKRKSDSLLENLDIVANRVLEFVEKSNIYNDPKFQKIVFEFYIMYIYKLFISKENTLNQKWKELKKLLNMESFQLAEKRSRGTDNGKFYKLLRFSIKNKILVGIWIACIYRYK